MHTFPDNISADLVLVLTLFAVFAWATRRGLLASREAGWVGTALVFFGVSLVFNAVLRRNGLTYPHQIAKLLGISLLMILPLLLTLGYGVFALARTLIPRTLCTVQIDATTVILVQGNPATYAADPPPDALLWPVATDLLLPNTLRAFGGPAVAQEARILAPLSAGKAVRIGAGNLPAKHLILAALHAPKTEAKDADTRRALEAALRCARQNSARRIALPPFGGVSSMLPPAACAALTVAAVVRARKDLDWAAIVVLDRRLLPAFQAEFDALAQKHRSLESPRLP